MIPVAEISVVFALFMPVMIIGVVSNGFLLFLIFKNVNNQSSLNLLSLPFFIAGILSALVLLPLTIINIFNPPSILCYSAGITHYGIQSICEVTLLCLILLRSIYIFQPRFLTKYTSKQITISCIIIIIFLSSIMTFFIFQQNIFPTIFPACQMEQIEGSSFRFSLYFGIGVFLTVFLWAISNLMDVLTKRENVKTCG